MRKVNADNTANTAVADNEPPKLLPKVIMYDKVFGMPINAQDVRAAGEHQAAEIVTVPWTEWLRGRVAQTLGEKTAHVAAINLVLHSLHTRGRIDEAQEETQIPRNSLGRSDGRSLHIQVLQGDRDRAEAEVRHS